MKEMNDTLMKEMNNTFYSQFNEDAVLAGIFGDRTSGTCLEVGALDGVKDSTTLYFEKKGWSCILVEANPELAEKAKVNRRALVFSCAAGRETGDVEFLIARGAEYLSTMVPTEYQISRMLNDGAEVQRIKVPVRRLDDILNEAGISNLDFATIDVEGAELQVLEGFDLHRWNPKVLVLEENSGGHDRRVRRHLSSWGYRCFYQDGLNAWYARQDNENLLTPMRKIKDCCRQIRLHLYEWTVGLLPLTEQEKLVKWKHKLLGRL
jgi:FkbM family methyltransferase